MTPQPNSAIYSLHPYEPGLALEQVAATYNIPLEKVIKLASNENPLGPSPKAQAILRQFTNTHRYPDQYELLQTLADFHHITPDMLLLGNGSNDVLDLIARTYLTNDSEAISSQYSFIVYQLATQIAGARNVIVPAAQFGHDLTAMKQAITPNTKVVWIANPNNPTGTFISYRDIHSFLAQVPPGVVVVFDEAYYDYLAPEDKADAISWIKEFPNLIIVRTFSKIYGLAGLRIGYGVTSPEVAGYLNRVRQTFNASTVALAAAQAALSDTEFVAKSHEANKTMRTELLAELQRLGLECLPAYGNFVTFKIPDTLKIHEALLRQGVIVRPLRNYGMPEWLRVTVGTPAESQQFLEALQKVI